MTAHGRIGKRVVFEVTLAPLRRDTLPAAMALAHCSYMVRLRGRAADDDGRPLVLDQVIKHRGILGREPANEFALDTLISHFIEHRDYDEAKTWYEKATAANPGRFPPDA